MKGYKNSGRDRFLSSIPTASLDLGTDELTKRSKFNFHYFCADNPGQDFGDWSKDHLTDLLQKLKQYSQFPLAHWEKQTIGKSGTVLAIYGQFPSSSDFSAPKNVPHQARWARFRLDHTRRLIGFVIPEKYNGQFNKNTGFYFDTNTFYVVFLDANHLFYKTE